MAYFRTEQNLTIENGVMNQTQSNLQALLNEVVQQRQLSGYVHLNREVDEGQSSGLLYQELFEKVLSKTDVGQRLIVPKSNAVKDFPLPPKMYTRGEEAEDSVTFETIDLCFVDKDLKPWSFRYCYVKSSKSFALTKYWSRFVWEKGLKVNDSVIFYKCKEFREGQPFFMIDTRSAQGQRNDIGRNIRLQVGHSGHMLNEEGRREEENEGGIRLFGVNIN
ncbi:AP2/ERF and B3 domain-containing transcription factor At1g50680-like [Macadamia integrifolia]|uniref:AP2/ERF and B3 domain-containing transcription factor At1g50680-like n=1 Tax=Macadamia integrifolia TaxID=60698 RepID=UPI001C4F2C91|nr:AP2/ERF and B3 domain-containing transcription factor At1g50680-like [Macadamia integrifolia]